MQPGDVFALLIVVVGLSGGIMPRALRFIDQAVHRPVFVDQVMRGDLGLR